ncbi:MAG: phosphonate ABC transporter ATP-binding protein [Planctomycetota bacterium]|nr:MAG: phosphonate ABC transporter ATP-binding protein [Planctomycetota bacterium]REJ91508.1 MAG: phosphonate ABC transporter ATP-binding protein [Planctomycetota bacterium]
MIRFKAARKRFADGTVAVDDLTLEIPAGQFCVFLGASGAGKSSVLKLVNGMVQPTSGRVEFDGIEVVPRTYREIRPRIAMVHQQFNLVLRSTILRNVLAGALPGTSTTAAMLSLFPAELQQKACRLLERVGLSEKHLYRRAAHLSGGQQQRVAIARAFILDPTLVLADEPVASLDPEISRGILQLLRDASRESGTTVMCSLHQPDLAREFADRIVGLARGKVIFDGLPDQLDEEMIGRIYAGARAARETAKDDGPVALGALTASEAV